MISIVVIFQVSTNTVLSEYDLDLTQFNPDSSQTAKHVIIISEKKKKEREEER